MRTIKIERLVWTVPPENQGQGVEVAYAADWESGLILRRIHDRSVSGYITPESTTYEAADADALTGEFEPHNGAPSIPADAWEEVRVVED